MANQSILAAFERLWQHVVAKIDTKADLEHTHEELSDLESRTAKLEAEEKGWVKIVHGGFYHDASGDVSFIMPYLNSENHSLLTKYGDDWKSYVTDWMICCRMNKNTPWYYQTIRGEDVGVYNINSYFYAANYYECVTWGIGQDYVVFNESWCSGKYGDTSLTYENVEYYLYAKG